MSSGGRSPHGSKAYSSVYITEDESQPPTPAEEKRYHKDDPDKKPYTFKEFVNFGMEKYWKNALRATYGADSNATNRGGTGSAHADNDANADASTNRNHGGYRQSTDASSRSWTTPAPKGKNSKQRWQSASMQPQQSHTPTSNTDDAKPWTCNKCNIHHDTTHKICFPCCRPRAAAWMTRPQSRKPPSTQEPQHSLKQTRTPTAHHYKMVNQKQSTKHFNNFVTNATS